MAAGEDVAGAAERPTAWTVFRAFLMLGLTSFGGPVAHIGYFRHEFVERRRWMDEHSYADLVALCQFLPGPASSQTGMAIGLMKAGFPGAFAAWVGFTLPSAVVMALFGFGVVAFGDAMAGGWLRGLKIVAVAVVAQAVWAMARTLCPDPLRLTMAAIAAAVVLLLPWPLIQVAAIVVGALAGWMLLKPDPVDEMPAETIRVAKPVAIGALALFFVILIGLPFVVAMGTGHAVALFDSFYRAGALVFGGGHVVLPLLQAEVVPTGWVSDDAFIAGYGAAQAVPGPLFTFAAYLGTVAAPAPNGLAGAAIALVAIFLPSFLLVVGVLPYWDVLRRVNAMRAALMGANATVVGLLLAALYDPVWTSAIHVPGDFALALAALVLLTAWRLPPWLVVLLTGLAGAAWTAAAG